MPSHQEHRTVSQTKQQLNFPTLDDANLRPCPPYHLAIPIETALSGKNRKLNPSTLNSVHHSHLHRQSTRLKTWNHPNPLRAHSNSEKEYHLATPPMVNIIETSRSQRTLLLTYSMESTAWTDHFSLTAATLSSPTDLRFDLLVWIKWRMLWDYRRIIAYRCLHKEIGDRLSTHYCDTIFSYIWIRVEIMVN
jgi:hypothetical protein